MPMTAFIQYCYAPLASRYERSGYLFAGWNSAPQGNGTTFTNEQIVENLATVEGSVIVFMRNGSQSHIFYRL